MSKTSVRLYYMLLGILAHSINYSHQTTFTMLVENMESQQKTLHFSFAEQDMSPFKRLGNSYYLFGTEQKITWYRASHICRTYNADLVSIESAAEMKMLSDYLLEAGYKTHDFWTSGNDLDVENAYFWHGTGQAFTYSNWLAPQPDNYQNSEDCVALWTRDSEAYAFNDAVCENREYYICEKRSILRGKMQ